MALKICDVCGAVDELPHHMAVVPPNTPGAVPSQAFIDALPDGVPAYAIAELLANDSFVRHFACCAAQGCPASGTDADCALRI